MGSGRGTCGHLEAAARFRRGRPQSGTVRGTGWVGSPVKLGEGPLRSEQVGGKGSPGGHRSTEGPRSALGA